MTALAVDASTTEFALVNGNVLTVDAAFSTATALAVRDGVIVAVGTDEQARSAVATGAPIVDLAGRTVIPGLIDTHAHMDSWWRNYPSLGACSSIADVQAVVAQQAAERAPGEWIVLRQLADPEYRAPHNLAEGRYPSRRELDQAAPRNPVWIRGTYCSPSIVNSAALGLAGITRDTPQPQRLVKVIDSRTRDWIPSPGGHIDFDARTGEPTGVLYDHDTLLSQPTTGAMARQLPRRTDAERVHSLHEAMAEFNALGITAVHEGHGVSNPVDDCTRAFMALWSDNRMSVRTQLVPNLYTNGTIDDVVNRLDQLSHASHLGSGDDMLRFAGVGLTLDGPGGALDSVQPKTATWPGPRDEIRDGVRRISKAVFLAVTQEAARRGLRLCTKAGGEGMIDWLIEAYGAADERWSIRERRWIMVHSQFAHPRQLDRLRELGVVPATCANFLWNHGAAYVEGYGREVAHRSVPFRSFLDAGLPVSNESDTTPKNPMFALWLMITRTDGTTGETMGEHEKVSREQGLRILTNNGATLLGMQDRIGSIEPGKYADLVVLDADPLSVPEARVKDVRVDATVVGGRVVYSRAPGLWPSAEAHSMARSS